MNYPELLDRYATLCRTVNEPHVAARRIVREALANAHRGEVRELNRVLEARWRARHVGEEAA